MDRPNILLIMADQFRSDWLSCAGADYVETPNIDSIAQNGVRFVNAACNSPLCAPSRAAIAAGKYPHRLGVSDTTFNYPIDHPTYYQALRRSGYRVAAVGKTDLHKPEHWYGENGDLPVMYHLGFTDITNTEGKINAAQFGRVEFQDGASDELVGPYQRYLLKHGVLQSFVEDYRKRANAPVWFSAPSVLQEEYYHDGYIGQRACDFLTRVSDESPWHLFVSFVGPHDPWDAPLRYWDRVQSRIFPDSVSDSMTGKPNWIRTKQSKQAAGMSPEAILQVKRHYAAMISHIDDWIGRMMRLLDERNLRENTVIVFCSDHGEMMGDHGLLLKTVMYEGALRVPLIISDPRFSMRGAHGALAELVDLYPTILDIGGVSYDRGVLDGKSLIPLLSQEAASHKRYQISELQHTRMIFDGRYKLIENFNDINELYDLQQDPSELNNLIDDNPDLAHKMWVDFRTAIK